MLVVWISTVWPYVQCNIRYRSNLSLSHLRPLHLTSGKRWWSKLQPMICMHVYIYICTVILPSDSSIVCHLKATMCKVRSIYKYPMFHSYVQWHQYKDANISTQSLHKTPETWPLSLPSRTCCGFPSKSAKAPLSRPPSWRWRFGQHQVTQSFGQHHYIYIYISSLLSLLPLLLLLLHGSESTASNHGAEFRARNRRGRHFLENSE